jgi:protein-disulfide isomerase
MAKKKSTATRRKESQAASARAAAIRAEQERKERRRRSLVVTGIGVVVLAFVLVLGYIVQNSRDTTGQSSAPPAGAAGYAVPVGKASAPVTVTLYEDFICPFCGEFEGATRAKLQQAVDDGKVKLRYHVLNFLSRSSTTDYSLRAANAEAVVLDAAGPSAAKKFHDLLYEHQPKEGSAGLSDGQLVDFAVQAGASRSKASHGISDRTFEQWVKNGTSQASKDGVTGTPTIKVNGKELPGPAVANLAQQIDQAIAAGSGG